MCWKSDNDKISKAMIIFLRLTSFNQTSTCPICWPSYILSRTTINDRFNKNIFSIYPSTHCTTENNSFNKNKLSIYFPQSFCHERKSKRFYLSISKEHFSTYKCLTERKEKEKEVKKVGISKEGFLKKANGIKENSMKGCNGSFKC